MRFLLLLLAAALLAPVRAQSPPPKYEFRGAWIASVINLDWPLSPSGSPAAQRQDLITLFDNLRGAGVNAIVFQIRPEADALYASDLEPWSRWLTDQQGRAPNPVYDPLAFAVAEAHKRGMELHAWFNPYRVQRSFGSYITDPLHLSNSQPTWTYRAGVSQLLDPGMPAVRDHIARVIADVARRYDIDGVHFDDYFYPYPPDGITTQDAATYTAFPRGFTNLGDWRRDNVNLLVAQVRDSLQAIDPEIVFGISPFGIWKNGVPAGIVGLDAYNEIYADATAWLRAGTVDYVAPQLYWAFGGGQDYGKLAPWWASVASGRHIYPGLGVYRTTYSRGEIPRQIRFNRATSGIQGEILFRARFVQSNALTLRDSLRLDLYRHPALPPPMGWKDQTPPAAPAALAETWDGDAVTLRSARPATSTPAARFFALYRIQSATTPDYDAAFADARNLLALTADTVFTDRPLLATEPYYYVVRSVSANSIEGLPSNVLQLEGRAVTAEPTTPPLAFTLEPNAPNPFTGQTTFAFRLDRPATARLRLYNVLGQVVADILAPTRLPAGRHTVEWTAATLGAGVYFYTLDVEGRRATRSLTLIR